EAGEPRTVAGETIDPSALAPAVLGVARRARHLAGAVAGDAGIALAAAAAGPALPFRDAALVRGAARVQRTDPAAAAEAALPRCGVRVAHHARPAAHLL